MTLGDRVSAGIVLFALVYFGGQAVRVGVWSVVVILIVAALGVAWQMLAWRRAARAYPRPRNVCGS